MQAYAPMCAPTSEREEEEGEERRKRGGEREREEKQIKNYIRLLGSYALLSWHTTLLGSSHVGLFQFLTLVTGSTLCQKQP